MAVTTAILFERACSKLGIEVEEVSFFTNGNVDFSIQGTSTVADLFIGKLVDTGSAVGVYMANSVVANLHVGEMSFDDNWQANSGTTLNLMVSQLSGGAGSIENGTVNVTEAGIKSGMRQPCQVSTTADIADLAAGAPDTVDGVSVSLGDRVLVKDQSSASENGVYVVDTVGTGADGAWSRALDFEKAESGDIEAGVTYYIQEGTVGGGGFLTLTTTGNITIGSTSLVFENKTGGGAGSLGGSTGATDDAILLADGTGGSTAKSSDITLAAIRSPVKMPCRVATTADVADLAAGAPDAVDGVSVAVNDRILVWHQDSLDADPKNGVYTVTTVGTGSDGVWARAVDFDDATSDLIEAGNEVYVQEGDLNGGSKFLLRTTGAITIGSTALEFVPMSGLLRSDASSTEIEASGAFTTGVKWSDSINLRDHNELAVFFLPDTLGTVTEVTVVIAWSDDGSTVPFGTGDYYQLSDFDIANQTDGTFNGKVYTAKFTTIGGELVAGNGIHLSYPKRGGYCRIGVTADQNFQGDYSLRSQRLTV